jgi:DNA polymerase (family 10)|tara:strand:+ start:98 stop:595 length:498 start_codon:yes stop_codon:yes gene_type:complete
MGGKALNGNKITRDEAYDLYNHIINTHKLHRKHNRIQLCGSARRGKKQCGDLDIVFQDNENGDFKAWLLETFGTKKNGKPQTTVLYNGVQVEFYEATQDSWGTCTLMWTGSKWNNIKLRKAAKARDLKLSQHGLFDKDGNNLAAGKSEEQVFALLGFDYVEPQKR